MPLTDAAEATRSRHPRYKWRVAGYKHVKRLILVESEISAGNRGVNEQSREDRSFTIMLLPAPVNQNLILIFAHRHLDRAHGWFVRPFDRYRREHVGLAENIWCMAHETEPNAPVPSRRAFRHLYRPWESDGSSATGECLIHYSISVYNAGKSVVFHHISSRSDITTSGFLGFG